VIPRPARSSRAARPRGFSTIEVLVALTLIAVVSLVSWAYTTRVTNFSTVALGLIGEHSPSPDGQTARLRTIAGEWVQAELEYARQLGWEGLCVPAAGQTACTDYVPFTDCTGAAAQGAPLSEGPAQPPELPYGRIVVSWDPHTPSDSTETQYLQLVEVDVYRTQADCQSQTPFLTGYTSVSIR
jgi:prepilin-type N-terminal cleavage/methylation domain-containing protein